MKKSFLLFLFMFININFTFAKYNEGDIIFQISKSSQSKFIMYATKSVWTHCGIIVYKNNKPYVLEASNVVKLTSLKSFINRGRFGLFVIKHVINKPVKVKYQKYLGIPYDSQFSLNNKLYYCSELVWVIYKEQFGIELCQPKSLSYYNINGLEKVIKRRNISKNSKFIAPSDIKNSAYLK